jgi:hypothetical protein
MSEMKIELISEQCKECPMLDLETLDLLGGNKSHRCRHIQACRKILGYWKEKNRIEELKIEYEEKRNRINELFEKREGESE